MRQCEFSGGSRGGLGRFSAFRYACASVAMFDYGLIVFEYKREDLVHTFRICIHIEVPENDRVAVMDHATLSTAASIFTARTNADNSRVQSRTRAGYRQIILIIQYGIA